MHTSSRRITQRKSRHTTKNSRLTLLHTHSLMMGRLLNNLLTSGYTLPRVITRIRWALHPSPAIIFGLRSHSLDIPESAAVSLTTANLPSSLFPRICHHHLSPYFRHSRCNYQRWLTSPISICFHFTDDPARFVCPLLFDNLLCSSVSHVNRPRIFSATGRLLPQINIYSYPPILSEFVLVQFTLAFSVLVVATPISIPLS